MTSLVEFLRARLNEDETEINRHPDPEEVGDEERGYMAITELGWPCTPQLTVGKLRALAEVDAKRRIVELHGPADDDAEHCEGCNATWLEEWAETVDSCPTKRLLAQVYADHPDYDESWRP